MCETLVILGTVYLSYNPFPCSQDMVVHAESHKDILVTTTKLSKIKDPIAWLETSAK